VGVPVPGGTTLTVAVNTIDPPAQAGLREETSATEVSDLPNALPTPANRSTHSARRPDWRLIPWRAVDLRWSLVPICLRSSGRGFKGLLTRTSFEAGCCWFCSLLIFRCWELLESQKEKAAFAPKYGCFSRGESEFISRGSPWGRKSKERLARRLERRSDAETLHSDSKLDFVKIQISA